METVETLFRFHGNPTEKGRSHLLAIAIGTRTPVAGKRARSWLPKRAETRYRIAQSVAAPDKIERPMNKFLIATTFAAALASTAPAYAALTDNALTDNALTDNALTDNALTDNALTDNALGTNALGTNALGTNALTDNALGTNALYKSGLISNGVAAGAMGSGTRVLFIKLPQSR
jgi:hypothetical protein